MGQLLKISDKKYKKENSEPAPKILKLDLNFINIVKIITDFSAVPFLRNAGEAARDILTGVNEINGNEIIKEIANKV